MVSEQYEAGELVAERYRVRSCLGFGAYGNVYFVVDERVGNRPLALKVLHAGHDDDSVEAQRFEREAPLLGQLEHPHIVKVVDAGTTAEGCHYIVFELLHGRCLKSELQRVAFMSDSRAGHIVLQISKALEYAHELGVVHRDLKPANIFLLEDGETPDYVKVLDFGVARVNDVNLKMGETITVPGEMIGTLHYMSPEQVRGATVGPASDVYTLGLVLAELLSGERLCPGTSQIEVMLKHDEAAEFELPRAVSTSFLAPIVERAVRKAVADRFPSAAAMRTELEAVVTVLGPPTTTSGTILLPEHLRSAATPGSTVDLTDDSEPS